MVHSALKQPVEEEMEHCLTQADLRISEETFMIKKKNYFLWNRILERTSVSCPMQETLIREA